MVWKQSGTTHDRLYWLAVPKDEPIRPERKRSPRRRADDRNQSVEKFDDLLIRLDERMVDLDKAVRVVYRGRVLFDGRSRGTIATLVHTLDQRGDPQLMFDAEVEVKLPK